MRPSTTPALDLDPALGESENVGQTPTGQVRADHYRAWISSRLDAAPPRRASERQIGQDLGEAE